MGVWRGQRLSSADADQFGELPGGSVGVNDEIFSCRIYVELVGPIYEAAIPWIP